MEWILTIATILGGASALWFLFDKFRDREKSKTEDKNTSTQREKLSSFEERILEELRGKPDVNWNRELILNRMKMNGRCKNSETEDIRRGIEHLIEKGYLNTNTDFKISITERAIRYYKSERGL